MGFSQNFSGRYIVRSRAKGGNTPEGEARNCRITRRNWRGCDGDVLKGLGGGFVECDRLELTRYFFG